MTKHSQIIESIKKFDSYDYMAVFLMLGSEFGFASATTYQKRFGVNWWTLIFAMIFLFIFFIFEVFRNYRRME